MSPARRGPGGFTLIEMLVVLALLGVLAAAARPVLQLSAQRSQEFELRQALRTLRGALDAYHQAVLDGHVASAADASGYPPDLQALVRGVPDAKSPQGRRLYFLRRLPRDPFADPTLPSEATWGLRAADSPPDAPRPGRDVFDVYSLSPRRALDGSLYREW
ncbi:type II secretion system protein [Roseateles sp. BYS180W]|uniref:Type II secretion system protein n=1 Tax=Roseateles rivi TaxID=3299028 RepID=A0ABW7FX77_9BURK